MSNSREGRVTLRRRERRTKSTGASLLQSIDWNKFMNFRSRNTRKDLDRLLANLTTSKTKHKELLEQPDKTGLYPIHWAAIHNRSDMMESLYEAGSPLTKQCRNRLFANGTPLHLASLNGSLEAAATLLSKSHELERHKTRPKSLASQEEDNDNNNNNNNNIYINDSDSKENETNSETKKMLEARDTDGQTPLMRAAAPRSKRMDTIRDLLRKNFWSLSGRPAEMALFLICMGADWRLTEPISGMNLLHLAIVNDYDDIVSLLLVLDKGSIDIPTLIATHRNRGEMKRSYNTGSNSQGVQKLSGKQENLPIDQFETVGLRSIKRNNNQPIDSSSDSVLSSQTTTPTNEQSSSGVTDFSDDDSPRAAPTGVRQQSRPLIDSRRDRADELLASGLTPLQLAILYGRISIIAHLWHASEQLKTIKQHQIKVHQQQQQRERKKSIGEKKLDSKVKLDGHGRKTSHIIEAQQEALKEEKQSPSNKELKRILIRACYSNKQELAKFLKPALLKGALALDLACLALFWAPLYATSTAGGVFLVSYVISMVLALRVMLKNPGYLRRNSVQYLAGLAKLLDGRAVRKAPADYSTSGIGGREQQIAQQARKSVVERREEDDTHDQKESPPPSLSQQQPTRIKSPFSKPLIRLDDSSESQDDARGKQVVDSTRIDLFKKEEGKNGERVLVETTSGVGGAAVALTSVNAFRDLQDKVRLFCHKCQCIRRPRSRHCNSCNHCVQDFDHHCIYLGCCVGRFNRLDFLMTMVALSITSIYGTGLHSMSMDNGSSLWHLVGFIWIFKYALIGAISSFLILRRACLGITLYEEVRSKRIRRTFGREGPPNEINKSHRAFSTLKGSFWRYSPDRFSTGDLSQSSLLSNLREFTNYISPDEYLLTFICTDTPLARSLTSSDSRMKQLYKFV